MPSSSTQRVALTGLIASVALAAAAFAAAFTGGAEAVGPAVALAVATATMMASLIVLAGRRGGSTTVLAAGLVVLMVGGGVTAALVATVPTGPDDALIAGLPLGAAWMIYGAGLVPAVVIPLVYAWSFDRTTLPPEALDAVRGGTASGRAARRDGVGPESAGSADVVAAESVQPRDDPGLESPGNARA